MRYLIIIIFCLFIFSFYVHVEHSSVLIKYHNKFVPIQNDALNKKIKDQYDNIKEMRVQLNKISTSLDSFKIEKIESFEIDDRNFKVSIENNDLDNNYSVPVPDGRTFGSNKKESQKFDSLQIAESYFESATTNSLKFKYVRNPDNTERKVEYIDYNYQISQISLGLNYNPNFFQAYIIRSNAYLELGDYLNALQDINLVIDKSQKSDLNYIIRGNIYFALEDYKNSIKDYKKALKLNPEDGSIHIGIGNAKYQLKLNYCKEYKKACDKGYCEAFYKFCNK